MSASEKSPPLSPSILKPNTYEKRKKYTDGSTQTESYYTSYVKSKENDFTALFNLPQLRFFYQRPQDPRNEYFGALISFEMESVQPEIRSQVYMNIINLIRNARAEDLTENQGTLAHVHLQNIDFL